MKLHWTIKSNELTQNLFCPIGVCRNLFESSSVWSYIVPQRCTGSSDICKNGWYLLLRRTIR